MKKKLLSILLALALCVSLLPVPAGAAGAGGIRVSADVIRQLPYAGDPDQCVMTTTQAAAYAKALRECVEMCYDTENYEYLYASEYHQTACVAALFDTGNGTPALWVVGGRGYGDGHPVFKAVDSIFQWDGSRIVETKLYGPGNSGAFGNRFTGFALLRNTRLALNYTGGGDGSPTISISDDWWDGIWDDNFDSYGFVNGMLDMNSRKEQGVIAVTPGLDRDEVVAELKKLHNENYYSYYENFPALDFSTLTSGMWDKTNQYGESVLYYSDGVFVNNLTTEAILNEGYYGSDVDLYFTGDWRSAESVAATLEDASDILSYLPAYGFRFLPDGVPGVIEAAARETGGEAAGVWELGDGLYYAALVVDGEIRGALVQGARENGETAFRVKRTDETPASEQELAAYLGQYRASPNLSLDFSRLASRPQSGETALYLREQLDNTDAITPNDAARSELAAFVESAISAAATGTLTGQDNRLTLSASSLRDLIKTAYKADAELGALLAEKSILPARVINVVLRVLWSDVDRSKPFELSLDPSLADASGEYAVEVLFGDGRHGVVLTPDFLREALAENEHPCVRFREEDGACSIEYIDEDGEVCRRFPAPLTASLPAEGPCDTVMASYESDRDNWGGQYDAGAGTLRFELTRSGEYEVLDNSAKITDISALGGEVQSAIRFMVSKGFLGADGASFRPDEPMTRYDFNRALVGMFFALDRDLTDAFPDVPKDSPYFAYIASAKACGIAKGFENGAFGGERNITVEQMLAVGARALVDQKGYAVPDDPWSYLAAYDDGADTGSWAMAEAALAVREGLIDSGGQLNPKGDVSRAQAAQILCRLFKLLYEASPVTLELPEAPREGVKSGFPVVPAIGGAGALVLMVTALVLAICDKKRRRAAAQSGAAARASMAAPILFVLSGVLLLSSFVVLLLTNPNGAAASETARARDAAALSELFADETVPLASRLQSVSSERPENAAQAGTAIPASNYPAQMQQPAPALSVTPQESTPAVSTPALQPAESPATPEEMLQYFINHCDTEAFSRDYVMAFDKEQCKYARNAVYAKAGRKFTAENMRSYFEQYDWYQPTIEAADFQETMLNSYELANRDVVTAYEQEMGWK
ncbi:MAG: YARHG domain-containing protein [Oscillospiraceae bacterium]|nr:YARHG domain-containing protein [Oscillospiraceae bacterium]